MRTCQHRVDRAQAGAAGACCSRSAGRSPRSRCTASTPSTRRRSRRRRSHHRRRSGRYSDTTRNLVGRAEATVGAGRQRCSRLGGRSQCNRCTPCMLSTQSHSHRRRNHHPQNTNTCSRKFQSPAARAEAANGGPGRKDGHLGHSPRSRKSGAPASPRCLPWRAARALSRRPLSGAQRGHAEQALHLPCAPLSY